MNTPREIPDGTRAIVYTRVSTPKQAAPEKASLDAQLAACRAAARDLGHASPFVVEDKGRSAFKEKGRIESLVDWCEAHKGDGLIIAYTHSRFARVGGADSIYWVVRLKKAGWALRFVDSPISGNVTVDDMTNLLKFSMAHAESVEKQKRSHVGGRGAADRGKWNGGAPPLGYVVGPDKRLAPGAKADVEKVRRAFKAYAEGATLDAVARALGKNPSGARHILANPAYVGTIEYGRRKGSAVRGAMEEAHPPLVARGLWDRVQARLASPNPRFAHGATRPAPAGALPYVLSMLVRCSCGEGRFLVGGGGVPAGITEAQRLRLRTYQCKACRGRVQQAALEAAVHGAIIGSLREWDEAGKLERTAKRWVEARVKAGDAAAVEAERADLLKRKARLLRLVEETDDVDARRRLAEIAADLRRLDAAGKSRPDAKALKAEAARIVKETRAAIAGGHDSPQAVNLNLQRLRSFLAAATWDRETRLVEVNFTPWLHETSTIAVPKARRAKNSGSSAPWRARASRRAVRPRT